MLPARLTGGLIVFFSPLDFEKASILSPMSGTLLTHAMLHSADNILTHQRAKHYTTVTG